VEKKESKVEQRAGDWCAIDEDVFFGQVPAARANQQRGGLVFETMRSMASIRLI
jgi:hypothetical protein